jgi:hypothetical protein
VSKKFIMKITDNLFTLVKSLNKTEKGYLKKHSGFHVINNERNNYIKIFDAIDAQHVYDESRLLKKFKNERFINQFAVAKNYLYDIILESLEAYNKTFISELRSSLNRAEILMGKGLFRQAKKILKKAKKNAADREEFMYVLEINLLEQAIDRLQYNEEELKNSIETGASAVKNAVAQIENIQAYEQLKDQLYLQYLENGSSYTLVETKNFGWIVENPLLKNKDQALSVRAKILFNELYATYYEYIGDFEKSYIHSLSIRQEIQKNPLALKIMGNSHASFLYYHSMRCANKGMQVEAFETIHFMERLPRKAEVEKNNLSFMIIRVKLKIYFQMKKQKECLALISEIEDLLHKDVEVDSLLKEEMYQQLITLLIILKEYKVAFKWFIKKNKECSPICNHDLNFTERILEMVFHYELDNLDIVNNRLKSAHRFLFSKNKLNSWENTILSFFYYLLNDFKRKTMAVSNSTFLSESTTIHALESNSLSHFVIVSWLKNKINDKKNNERKQQHYSIAEE